MIERNESHVQALIDAAVEERLEWDKNGGRPSCDHCQETEQALYDATGPFLPLKEGCTVEAITDKYLALAIKYDALARKYCDVHDRIAALEKMHGA